MTYQYSFPKEIEFLVSPVVDKRGLSKDNWYLDENSIRIVMDEVRKFGIYFADKIVKLLV